MFITDYVHSLKITDIGFSWVYLSWEELLLSGGPLHQQYSVTCNEATSDITVTETSHNITDLTPSITYSCTVMAVSEAKICSLRSPPVLLTPGKNCTAMIYGGKVSRGKLQLLSKFLIFQRRRNIIFIVGAHSSIQERE